MCVGHQCQHSHMGSLDAPPLLLYQAIYQFPSEIGGSNRLITALSHGTTESRVQLDNASKCPFSEFPQGTKSFYRRTWENLKCGTTLKIRFWGHKISKITISQINVYRLSQNYLNGVVFFNHRRLSCKSNKGLVWENTMPQIWDQKVSRLLVVYY